jgi:hypothetical protein
VRIDLLGLAASPDRYASLQKAIDVRVPDGAPDYDTLVHENLSPGEVVSAAFVAGDSNATAATVVASAQSEHEPVLDVGVERKASPLALEIMLGLVYLDYTDDPESEAQGHP